MKMTPEDELPYHLYLALYQQCMLESQIGSVPNKPTYIKPPKEESTMASPITKYFEYSHLPEHLQKISAPIGELAFKMDAELPDGAEKSAGLRKLLEAKDCLVRAALD